ncbi:hypothetical protein [Streptomyces sp. NBC_00344]|uniref:hypothetical protein n=1 Tax=Streptomyces sp. NBC_00344 TaxID=2975720 RepID=UPI002E1FBAFC
MSDDSLAHGELDALTRRTEAVEDRVESLQVQTGGNFAAVIEGQAALRREVRDGFTAVNTRLDVLSGRFDRMDRHMDGLSQQVDSFITEQRNVNATLVELLSGLVGKDTTQD